MDNLEELMHDLQTGIEEMSLFKDKFYEFDFEALAEAIEDKISAAEFDAFLKDSAQLKKIWTSVEDKVNSKDVEKILEILELKSNQK